MPRYAVKVEWTNKSGKKYHCVRQIVANNEAEAEIMAIKETKNKNQDCKNSSDITAKVSGRFGGT